MCRGRAITECVLLGTDRAGWDRESPLPPPGWFHEAVRTFERAVALASVGDIDGSQAVLAEVREPELREFYEEHGQQAYRFRMMGRSVKRPAVGPEGLDPIRAISTALAQQVMRRDGYRCRYCGIPVVPKEVLNAYGAVMGAEVFPTSGSNARRHGVVLAFRANVDHVAPYQRGGRTDLDNLVTSCWSCNYGKNRFTVEELGLTDPRDRPPAPTADWVGLTQYLVPLRRRVAG